MSTMDSAPQGSSELEVDERRKAISESLLRGVGDGTETRREEIIQLAHELVTKPWMEQLTVTEVAELSAIEGWDWHAFLDYQAEPKTTLRDLVEHQLYLAADYFHDEGGEMLAGDFINGTDYVAANLRFFRFLASTYGFDLGEQWENLRNDKRR